jgi:hypothetical protein
LLSTTLLVLEEGADKSFECGALLSDGDVTASASGLFTSSFPEILDAFLVSCVTAHKTEFDKM